MTSTPDSDLLQTARRWVVDNYPYNSFHLLNTLEWLDRLAPGSHEAVRLAAITHDMERAFPGPDQPQLGSSLTDPTYNRLHAERSARIVAAWFRTQTTDERLVTTIESLVRAHEVGGWPEANALQAADSISFLDANLDLALNWVRTGRFPAQEVRAKLDYSYDRIQLPVAKVLAAPLLERACSRLLDVASEIGSPSGPAHR